jgi:hypothetical protein
MKRVVIGFSLGALFVVGTARAQSSASTHYVVAAATPYYGPSASLLLGIATADLNLGVGARGGYTLPNNVYVGGTIVYHTGTSTNDTVQGVNIQVSSHLFYLGPEGGYDVAVGPVLIRPFLGLGLAPASISTNCSPPQSALCTTVSRTDTNFALWLGGDVLYPLGMFYVGGDLRALFVQSHNSIGVFATGGITF